MNGARPLPIDRALVEAAAGAPFLKVSGGGNDFVLIDNRNGRLRGDLGELVRRVCHRGLGVGADGLILNEWPTPGGTLSGADLRMVYFNRDGGEAALCANGVRCVARWAAETGAFPRPVRIETGAGVLPADGAAQPPWITLPMGAVKAERRTLRLGAGEGTPAKERGAGGDREAGRTVEGVLVMAGVPHLVVEVPDAFAPTVLDDAPALRHHPDLGPGGANVDFFTARGGGRVDARYYERGVEGETLSSGSGTIAVALAATRLGRATSPITCTNRLGLESTVTLEDSPDGLAATLAGDARIVYSGRLRRETLADVR